MIDALACHQSAVGIPLQQCFDQIVDEDVDRIFLGQGYFGIDKRNYLLPHLTILIELLFLVEGIYG